MALQEKQLAQTRENSTNAVSVYSPGANITAIIRSIIVANTSGSTAKVRIFIDGNGTTYDESTAIAWDIVIPADNIYVDDGFHAMNDSNGNLAYRSDTANALTITVEGAEIA